MTQHPEEGTLHAYIDGELPAVEAAALEAHVAGCQSCAAALAEARGLVAAASRAISALDVAPSSARPAASIPPAAVPARRKIKGPIFRMPYARAAALLLLVGGSALVVDRSGTLEREGASRTELLTTEEAMPLQVAPSAVSEAAAAATPDSAPAAVSANAPTRLTQRDAASGSDSRAADGVRRNETGSTGAAADLAVDAAARVRRVEPTAAPSAPAPLAEGQGVSFAASTKRPASATDSAARSSIVAAPPAAPPPARPSELRLSEVGVAAVSGVPGRVTRYRTKEGAILTLTEELSRASFAEETASARRMAAQSVPQRAAPQTAQAGAAALILNSYRWTNTEQGRTYTLTGSLTIAELEALSKRLGELERVP